MSSNSPVYVGVDGSATSGGAAGFAADEAAAWGAELVILHVGEPDGRAVDNVLAHLRLRHPTVVHSVRHVPDHDGPAVALAEAAGDGCLLVVGHRGHRARRGASPGSVAQRLVDIATVPTVVFRPVNLSCAAPEPRSVLVGVNPHDWHDAAVLKYALSEAARRRTHLDIVCSLAEGETSLPAGLAESIQDRLARHPGIASRLHLRPGIDPAIALMVDSHTAQLAVVGAEVGPAIQSTSIAHALVHRAACPVAIVPRCLVGHVQDFRS